jgi:hypothetical protein
MGLENYDRGGRQKNIYTESDVVFVSCPLCENTRYKQIYKERGALGHSQMPKLRLDLC